jgi:4-coumarate--CoA ligase (photoactive yellow protein activation family)
MVMKGVPEHLRSDNVLTQEGNAGEKRRSLSIPHRMCLTTTVPPSGFHEQGLLRGSLESLVQKLSPGDLVVASPAYWHWLDRTMSVWPEDFEGVTATAACPPVLIESLLQKGLQGMTEIYGSTETSGVGVRKWPAERYHLMPHWRPSVLVSSSDPLQLTSSLGRQTCLMDTVEINIDGTFAVVGRRDAAVQVGGTKVFPSRVATLLGSQPGVNSAAVRLMRPTEGYRLKAFVVPQVGEDEEALLLALQSWIALNLSVAERPTAIQFGDGLPLTQLGKDADW